MLPKSKVLETMSIWEQESLVGYTWAVLYSVWDISLNMLSIMSLLWLQDNIWAVLQLSIHIGLLNLGLCFLASRENFQVIKAKPSLKNKVKIWWQNNCKKQRKRKKKNKKRKYWDKNMKGNKDKTKVVLLQKLADYQDLENYQFKTVKKQKN